MQRLAAVAVASSAVLALALLGGQDSEVRSARAGAPAVGRATPASTTPASTTPASTTPANATPTHATPANATPTSAVTGSGRLAPTSSSPQHSGDPGAPPATTTTGTPGDTGLPAGWTREDSSALDAFVTGEVDKIAAPLALDPPTQACVVELTRRAFLDLMSEIRDRTLGRRAAPSSPDNDDESTAELTARRTRELHARILEALTPEQRPRYRELVGLDRD